MPDLLCRAIFPHVNGQSKDTVVNDFAFTGLTDPGSASVHLEQFYNNVNVSRPLGDYIGSTVTRSLLGCRIDTWILTAPQLAGAPLGSPALSSPFTLTGPLLGTNLPAEVSVVGSFNADISGVLEEVGVTRPRSRRRGRIYIGPLQDNILFEAGSGICRPSNTFTLDLRTAMNSLRLQALSEWGVWSRADAAINEVVRVWTDDAFDTQRRRGEAATGKTFLP